MLDIIDRGVAFVKDNANDMQVKRLVRAIPVKFKPGKIDTVKQARASMSLQSMMFC